MRLTCGVDQPVEMEAKSEAKSESVFRTSHLEFKHKIIRTSDIGLRLGIGPRLSLRIGFENEPLSPYNSPPKIPVIPN